MMNKAVSRPKAPKKKIRTSEDFELCYLRHQYFRRVKYNPTEAEMHPYMKIVVHFTGNTFFTYFNLFKAVGMYREDVLNIGRVHLVSFLGLYALENMEKKREEFIDRTVRNKFRMPTENDFDQKNKANFTMFFKQRMEDLVRVCRQKVRNIKGQPSEEYTVFCGKENPPAYHRILLKEHEKFGYKKVDLALFKSIRKRAGVNHDATVFKFYRSWYVAIPLEQKSLDLDDVIGSGSNPYDNYHNMQPDDILMEKQFDGFSNIFNEKPTDEKETILKNFIAGNEFNVQYREEISTARKLLKSLGE